MSKKSKKIKQAAIDGEQIRAGRILNDLLETHDKASLRRDNGFIAGLKAAMDAVGYTVKPPQHDIKHAQGLTGVSNNEDWC